jgi:hypothetical protein
MRKIRADTHRVAECRVPVSETSPTILVLLPYSAGCPPIRAQTTLAPISLSLFPSCKGYFLFISFLGSGIPEKYAIIGFIFASINSLPENLLCFFSILSFLHGLEYALALGELLLRLYC